MTAAEKFVASPGVTVAARVAMFLTPILVSVALFILGNYLTGQTEAMAAFSSRVSAVEQVTGGIGTRVTTLETRINIGQQQREKFQDAVLATLADIQRQQLETAKAIARLEAKVSP